MGSSPAGPSIGSVTTPPGTANVRGRTPARPLPTIFALRSRVGAAALADKAVATDRAVARSVLNARFFDAVIDVLKSRVRHELRAKGLEQCAIAHAIATAALVCGVLPYFSFDDDAGPGELL